LKTIKGLDTDQPMFKIGNFVYKGEVDYSLGTDLIFEVDESKLSNDKDNLESSIHPSNASLKQSSSVYSYLMGEDPNNSSQGLPLIPLTQTTKKMVFHSVLLEQKDDELSGKDKLPESLIPNLSPNTLYMNRDSLLNSMSVDNSDISPVTLSGATTPSKTDTTKTKTIEKITLMDAVSELMDEKIEESKKEKFNHPEDLNNAETSQIFNPEVTQQSNTETTEFDSRDVSSQVVDTNITDVESTEVSQITNEEVIKVDKNKESKNTHEEIKETNKNKVSLIPSEGIKKTNTNKVSQITSEGIKGTDKNEISRITSEGIKGIDKNEISQITNEGIKEINKNEILQITDKNEELQNTSEGILEANKNKISQINSKGMKETNKNKISQYASEKVTENDKNEAYQTKKDHDVFNTINEEEIVKNSHINNEAIKDMNSNEISQSNKSIITIDSTEISQTSNVENSNAITISSSVPTTQTASPSPMDIDPKVPLIDIKNNPFSKDFEKIKEELKNLKKEIEENQQSKASIKLLKPEDIKKKSSDNKNKVEKPKRGPGRPRKKKSVDNAGTSTKITSEVEGNPTNVEEKPNIKRGNSIKKSTRGRKPKSASATTTPIKKVTSKKTELKSTSTSTSPIKKLSSKKSGPIEKYFNK